MAVFIQSSCFQHTQVRHYVERKKNYITVQRVALLYSSSHHIELLQVTLHLVRGLPGSFFPDNLRHLFSSTLHTPKKFDLAFDKPWRV